MESSLENQKGLTLIEVIVAIMILSFMMISIYTITNNNTTAKDRVTSEDRDYQSLQSALQRIEDDLLALYSPLYYQAEFDPLKNKTSSNTQADLYSGREETEEESRRFPRKGELYHKVPEIILESNSFTFLTHGHRRKFEGDKESHLAWIRYEWIADESESKTVAGEPRKGLKIIRYYDAQDPFALDFDWGRLKGLTLLKHVKSLTFSFWDTRLGKYVAGLRELQEHERYAIKGILVELTWIDSFGQEVEIKRTIRPLWPPYRKEQKNNGPKTNAPTRR